MTNEQKQLFSKYELALQNEQFTEDALFFIAQSEGEFEPNTVVYNKKSDEIYIIDSESENGDLYTLRFTKDSPNELDVYCKEVFCSYYGCLRDIVLYNITLKELIDEGWNINDDFVCPACKKIEEDEADEL